MSFIRGFSFLKCLIILFVMINRKEKTSETHSNERNISTTTHGVMGAHTDEGGNYQSDDVDSDDDFDDYSDDGDDDGDDEVRIKCVKEPLTIRYKFFEEFEKMKNSLIKKSFNTPVKCLMQNETAKMLTNLQTEGFCKFVWKKCPYVEIEGHSPNADTHDILIPEFYPQHTKDNSFDNMITNLSLLRCSINDDDVIDTTFGVIAFPHKRILFIFEEYLADPDDATILQYKLYGYFEYPESAFPYANWEIMQ